MWYLYSGRRNLHARWGWSDGVHLWRRGASLLVSGGCCWLIAGGVCLLISVSWGREVHHSAWIENARMYNQFSYLSIIITTIAIQIILDIRPTYFYLLIITYCHVYMLFVISTLHQICINFSPCTIKWYDIWKNYLGNLHFALLFVLDIYF